MNGARAMFLGALAGVAVLVVWRTIPQDTKAGWARSIVAAHHKAQGGCKDCPGHQAPPVMLELDTDALERP